MLADTVSALLFVAVTVIICVPAESVFTVMVELLVPIAPSRLEVQLISSPATGVSVAVMVPSPSSTAVATNVTFEPRLKDEPLSGELTTTFSGRVSMSIIEVSKRVTRVGVPVGHSVL